MIFEDRVDAGRQLAKRLTKYADGANVVVLGVPRGGAAVAYEVAAALHLPLDVFLSRKLGAPGHAELAFGAVAAGGGRFVDEESVRALGISAEQVETITDEVRAELDRRAKLYRGDREELKIAGKTVILVDDGVATGASLYTAIHALRELHPAKLVLAVPVAPASTWTWLGREVDERVCLSLPEPFGAVGAFYRDFAQVEDEEVLGLLREARRAEAETAKDA